MAIDFPIEAILDQLVERIVEILPVTAAGVTLISAGKAPRYVAASNADALRFEQLQFTFGEGPCLDAVRDGGPVLVADLGDPGEQRWPAFREAALEDGVNAVFAMPVAVASAHVGAMHLFNRRTGSLTSRALAGALFAAELAALPLLDLMTTRVDWGAAQGDDGWEQLASLERVEVYQATGRMMAALDAGPTVALARLRGHAYADGKTASEVAWAVVERRLFLDADDAPQGAG